jgi:RNA polymerase sigma factor (sigma-70 family)
MDPQALSLASHVPAAARGDRDAFAALVNGTRSVVSSIALAIVRDAELSRDVAQDVFLAAWRDLGQLRDPESFLPWLRQLTRNRAYHVLRTERRRAKRVTSADVDELMERAIDPRPDAGARLVADEERALLSAVLDALPDEAREVVTLYYREGQSTAHVAALLGLSDASVRQRLSRARAAMRADLIDRYGAAAVKSAPDAGFTAGVLLALTVGAPAASSAATVTAALTTGTPWVLKALTAGSGVLFGAAGGIAGVVIGARDLKRKARTIEELAAIKRFQLHSIVVVLVAAVLFPLSWIATGMPWSQAVVFVGFILALAGVHRYWLPRIQRDRHALEAIEDPVRAARDRRRERRTAILGWTLGILSGLAGLIAGILMAT